MSESTFNSRLAYNEPITAAEVEAFACGLYEGLLAAGVEDVGGKSYDPLTIDEERKVAHSYVFNLWDGGRHHEYKTLRGLAYWLLFETHYNMARDVAKSETDQVWKEWLVTKKYLEPKLDPPLCEMTSNTGDWYDR